jgi:amino acid permease
MSDSLLEKNTINDKNTNLNSITTKIEEEEEDISENKDCFQRYFGPIKAGSLRGSIITMASITFGGGCLAFPYAVAQCGPIVGLIIFILVAIVSYYSLYILILAGTRTKIYDYNQLVKITMGDKMLFFSDINNIIVCIGCIMSYQITVYKFALDLGEDIFNFEKSDNNRLILILICMVLIQLPLNCLRNISTLQYASIVGTIAIIISILLIVAEMPIFLYEYLKINEFPPLFKEINWGYLDTFSTFMFGFSSHNGVLQIFAEMNRPNYRRNNTVLFRSFLLEIFLYIGIAFGGFFSTFYDTPDVFLNRPDMKNFEPDYLIICAKITLLICLHCTMAINYNIMRMSLKSMWFDNQTIPFIKDFLIMFLTYCFCNIGVYFIQNVAQVLGIMGGFCTVFLCFFIPVIIHIKMSGLSHLHPLNLWRYLLLIIVCILGCMATTKSLIDIIISVKN